MKFMLLIYGNEAEMGSMTPEVGKARQAAYMAYTEALIQSGVLVSSNRLQPTKTATSVRIKDDKTQVLNGPYAESREQLAGYYLIDVPDMDTAISWASRCPGAGHGTMEVRPLWEMPG